MKRIWFALLVMGNALAAFGRQEAVKLDDEFLRSAEQWAKENLDEDALRVLQSVDQERVRQFFSQIQKQFQGEYVVDLAALKDTARTLLPLLERDERTLPYALWLKTRLDYLEVADQLRLTIPPPKTAPGQLPPPLPNPPAQKEREAWRKKIADRPWPKSAQPYVSSLKPVFAAQHAPPELVWIAEVESSFDPRSRSPAGAAGLFQLMPATARRFGLRSWPSDERLAPEPSAQAAAKYLQNLHAHFGDWRLALAAYNSGEGTVQDLLKRHHSHTFDAIAMQLPAETQMFVPKVEATLLRRENLTLSQLRAPAPTAAR